jgi:hypothetical protein
MATSNKSIFGPRQLETTRKLIEDDAALQPSFGLHVPDPTFQRGGVCAVGWLAGDNDLSPTRNISMDHSADHTVRYSEDK